MIDPTADRLIFVRFKEKVIFELIVRNADGAWIWYEATFCRRDQKTYLVTTEIGEPDEIPVLCYEGEIAAIFWADHAIVPEERVTVLAGGPVARLRALPRFLQDEEFRVFCAGIGYAAEMVPCFFCQDMFPISAQVAEESQQPCVHIHWCSACDMWSSPSYPGKEGEMEQCPHRSEDDLYYVESNQKAEN